MQTFEAEKITYKIFVLLSEGLKNIALGKSAYLSTQYGESGPERAVDGNLSTLAVTKLQREQWLMVDLGAMYYICSVTLTNQNLKGES